MLTGMIADIQRTCLHDGPGIRTTVFSKGCPLHCAWCHNPECISDRPQLMYYSEKCIGCGLCHMGCFSGAKVMCGKEMTVEEVMREILQDKEYFGSEGGVTFSGGEPLAQAEFLSALTDACKEEGIHCAIETSLIFYEEEVLKKMDLIMADLKIWNEEIHKRYTTRSNREIKEHFEKINALSIPIIGRTPVIPEIEQGIPQISRFLYSLENVKQYELLPYHPLGEGKRNALLGTPKKQFSKSAFSIPTKEFMEELEQYVFIR